MWISTHCWNIRCTYRVSFLTGWWCLRFLCFSSASVWLFQFDFMLCNCLAIRMANAVFSFEMAVVEASLLLSEAKKCRFNQYCSVYSPRLSTLSSDLVHKTEMSRFYIYCDIHILSINCGWEEHCITLLTLLTILEMAPVNLSLIYLIAYNKFNARGVLQSGPAKMHLKLG